MTGRCPSAQQEGAPIACCCDDDMVSGMGVVRDRAAEFGLGEQFERAHRLAEAHGLRVRAWTQSLMLAPAANGSRALVNLHFAEPGRVRATGSSDAWEQYYGVDPEELRTRVGDLPGCLDVEGEELTRLLQRLDRFLKERPPLPARIASRAQDGADATSVGLRDETLEEAVQAAATEHPMRLRVRDLIAMWGAKSRGWVIVEKIDSDLAERGLTTAPHFNSVGLDNEVELVLHLLDETADGDHQAAELRGADDIGIKIGTVPSALGGLVSGRPGDSLVRISTLMRRDDFSQIPILEGERILKGAVTWRSIAKAMLDGRDQRAAEAMESAAVYAHDDELVDALDEIVRTGFVFVSDEHRRVAGIVTTADVVDLYQQTATPFFWVGELDQLLRRAIRDEFAFDEITDLCGVPERTLNDFDDLSFGDYQRVVQSPEHWDRLGWRLDRKAFIERLEEMRRIRNSLAHFNSDPPSPEQVEQLRLFVKLVREAMASRQGDR